MFCPCCGTEYRSGFTHCSDCDVDLVPSLPAEFADERVIVAWGGEDAVAFSVALAALRAAKISARQILLMRRASLHRSAYEIAVRPEDADRASEIIRKAFDASR